ncbi:MAG: DASH family cryptochrome [Bacteroidia bacterium]|nr:DASH family cryptochrome [Bacteroidia bacterium]MDW8088358.1 DASH family cryptochrome [Bacteroidia bacterium]
MVRRVGIWLRNDLRLHDQPALQAALQAGAEEVIFAFVWGPPAVSWGRLSYPPPAFIAERRISPARERFLLEALLDLAERIPLYLLEGEPDVELPAWAAKYQLEAIYAHKEWAVEEIAYEEAVRQALNRQGVALKLVEANSLYDSTQLPFPLSSVPLLFTRFRLLVERTLQVPAPLPTPALPKSPPPLPSTQEWLTQRLRQLPPLREPFQGGERAGQRWVETYFQEAVFTYKQTRNAFQGKTFSSHFSPWLAVGCLSPRWVYQRLREAERRRGANDSTYWLFFELLWREYFRWLSARWGRKFFAASGLRGLKLPWQKDPERFLAWRDGKTGYPIVDAAMRELKTTGWMSNRARQIVASFFTKNLFLDWRWGAAYFEAQLIDYDVYSNWGNWLYQAGVGTDGRGFRWFDPVRQAKLYDSTGAYIRQWVAELASLRAPQIYMPEPGLRATLGYPQPIVDWPKSLAYAKDTYWRAIKGAPQGNALLKLLAADEEEE